MKMSFLAADGETAIVSSGRHKSDKESYEVLWLLTPQIVRVEGKAAPSPVAPPATSPPIGSRFLPWPVPAVIPVTGVTPVPTPPARP